MTTTSLWLLAILAAAHPGHDPHPETWLETLGPFAGVMAGLVAGTVHVFTGPDHLAAVLPFAVDRPRQAVRIGLFWGLGHGLGVVLLGLVFVAVRQVVDIEWISHGAELFVGALLVAVGIWAMRKGMRVVVHTHRHDHGDHSVHSHPHVHFNDETVDDPAHSERGRHIAHHHSTFGFGFIHGLAGLGHLFGALPALGFGVEAGLAYLCAYLLGGIVAMTAFAFMAASMIRRPAWVPRSLMAAGAFSVLVGLAWMSTIAFA